MDKLDSSSSDLLMINFGKIKEIFPEVVKEGKIDFDSLRFLLGDYIEGESERYNFTWFGKSKTRKIAQTPTTATLRPDKGRSVNWRASKNFFIEGDNLEALKVLQKSLHKSIKLIYIDPPYNTGNEFIYPDNFQDNIETYLSYTGQRSDEGVKFSTNVESGGRYHTNWLNMMYSRLRLARNLLKDDGAIFISIGDEELCNLKKMCDEIFGEENYRGMVSRLTGTRMGSGNTKISSEMDYILIYAKSDDFNFLGLPMSEKDLSIYDQEDENGRYLLRSLRRTGGENRREDRPSMFYPVISPDGEKVYPIAPEGWESRWVCGKDKYEELLKNDEIVWKKVKKAGEEKWQIYQKHYVGEATKFVANCWNDLDGNKKATREVNALFDGAKVFHHPKPVDLLERIIKITIEKNAEEYVLDFFGGSSTTAHAALKLKKEGYKINFGIIQLPEKCDESSVAFQNGFKTISDIGIGRIKKVIEKEELDTEGLQVFKLDSSNIKEWDVDENDLEGTLFDYVTNVKPNRTEDDLLYEIILKYGLPLNSAVEELTVLNEKLYSIGYGALLICLSTKVTVELVEEIAKVKKKLNPEFSRVLFRDNGFVDDNIKTNAIQTLKQAGVDEIKSL